MLKIMSLLKINILRHLVCDVTSSPFPRPLRGWGGNAEEKTVHMHDTATSGAIMTSPTSGTIMTSFPVGKNVSNLHEFNHILVSLVPEVTSQEVTSQTGSATARG